ncbi:Stage II sporulation protein P [Romboutsia ilealis]|uniref:Stage II sporulation protein P n=1 Tax=Romboutsia ilealis TaxID=1115758 RepID=A0A1V1HZ10_9FIRM|nr:stage II sporulation protein P [Romboutsia ilealis]CED93200.1 Stage II sporulation protein P [Romboutsia ilealis]
MLRKAKKIISIACILTFVLPIISYSIDKEEFLKFLIESSYPEASTNNDNSKEEKDKEDKTANNKEKDYIKVHIGEENVPTLNNKSDNKENISVASSEYKNDIRLTKEDPTMLIYHSHAGETYSDSPEGNYHSQNNRDKSVLEVGTLLTEQLSQKGWGVAHSTKYHDYPDFTKSYASSLETVKSMLNNHKNINIAIDLHRDGRDLNTDADMQKENERMTTTYNGEKVAKFFFVVGMKNTNVDEVQELAEDITKFAQSKYPELVLPIVKKQYGKFNQYMAKNHMLIEIGSNGTSSDEAKASVKYVAEILDEYFKQNR